MGQVLHTNGNYEVRTAEGGTILLNTGPDTGVVKVTGTLIVHGPTVTVESETMTIKDNIIVLNEGETGNGITLGFSGIRIDRGKEPAVNFLYNESDDAWSFVSGTEQIGFSFDQSSRIKLTEILTNQNTNNGNLTLIGSGTGVVNVGNRGPETPYHLLVNDDNDVPNKRFVEYTIEKKPSFQIARGDTRIAVFDSTTPVSSEYFPLGPYIDSPTISQAAVMVDNVRVARFTKSSFDLRGLSIFSEDPIFPDIDGLPASEAVTIQSVNTNSNLKLETSGTGKVQISYAMQFDSVNGVAPGYVQGSSVVYGDIAGGGTTGIYVATESYRDELTTKGRALLFSMIF